MYQNTEKYELKKVRHVILNTCSVSARRQYTVTQSQFQSRKKFRVEDV